MKPKPNIEGPLASWNKIPSKIRRAIRGLGEEQLDASGGSEGWSIREYVHHLVEANLIASNMIICAIAADGHNFDWTWVWPNKAWLKRMGYDKANVAPAIATLDALSRHISNLIAANPRSLKRKVNVNDTPDAERYALTVEQILLQEIHHADTHLNDIAQIRNSN